MTPQADPTTGGTAWQPATVEQAGAAFATLVGFLRSAPITAGIGALEHDLLNADRTTAATITTAAGLTPQLLQAALIVRRDVGRVSDVIHVAKLLGRDERLLAMAGYNEPLIGDESRLGRTLDELSPRMRRYVALLHQQLDHPA